ncbi:alpha/beta fold hydrolase [Rubrimonas cliftonensis]|uniref:Lysophospholipase n=1 Tax=Rubrimonas cliftonensis TaxID=89524 RepID=A0A1H4FBV5_9RHOB|nr:alpha/beta hydrolase [Rubrimonas cliftonensis]SEA94218.1 lysophospholipase [Rubrimonas cliftonensis]
MTLSPEIPTRAAPLGPGSRAVELTAADGTRLRAAMLEGGGRGCALLLQGRTEFAEKYAQVAQALKSRGFSVATIDWRGQGGSQRPLADPRKGHVGGFTEYQADLDALLAATADAGAGPPRLALAHSMGGAIALRAFVEGRLAPAAAVFSAPMWGLALSRPARAVAKAVVFVAARLRCAERYGPGGGPASYAETDPDPNVLTADPAQAEALAALTRANPDLALGGPTYGWLRAAFREMRALERVACPVPSLVLVGGGEAVTSPKAMAARAARDGMRLETIPGGRHELFLETPERQAAAWAAVDGFLAGQRL